MIDPEVSRKKAVMDTAARMLAAAVTAPKARALNNIKAAILEDNEVKALSEKMKELVKAKGAPEFFARDADNILDADAVLLIGTKISPRNNALCGLCGFANCAEKRSYPDHPCAFDTGDLGIAVGSAVSVAADCRVDSRIMFSVGMAARELGILGGEVRIVYGILLSASSKNPFFDRKSPDQRNRKP